MRYADIWDGEVYNASFDSYEEISMPSYPRSKTWKVPYEFKNFKGVVSPKVGPSVRIREFLDMKPLTAVVYDGVDQNGTDFGAIRVLRTIENPPENAVLSLKKGETVIYDMGQNMVGWEHFTVRGAQNTTIVIRHAEMLNDSGKASAATTDRRARCILLTTEAPKRKENTPCAEKKREKNTGRLLPFTDFAMLS